MRFPCGDARACSLARAMFGEDAYERALHALGQRARARGRVEFRGFRADIWHELARMDILVHASLTPEPFGQVVLEGMAARVPGRRGRRRRAGRDHRHGVNGLLYPMGDQVALASAMRRLAGDERQRRKLREGGLRTVRDYHPDKVAAQMTRLYQSVLTRSRGR